MTQAGPLVALLGQPNCGKTTLFNALTGSHSTTANYPGATVEYSAGTLLECYGWQAEVLDLPGIASLVPRSPDEQVAVQALYGQGDHRRPAAVIAVADCAQLSRHLYLIHQLRTSGLPLVVAITMSDLLERRGSTLDPAKLEKLLDRPVVVVDGRIGKGVAELMTRVRLLVESTGPVTLHPVEEASPEQVKKAYREIEAVEQACVSSVETANAGRPSLPGTRTDPLSSRIDGVLLHPVMGLLAFVLIMGLLFTGIFWAARPLMDAVAFLCDDLANRLLALAPGSFGLQLLADGVIRGAGAVLAFVPQIVILFLGLGLMEDSGYLARAAVLVDRPLAVIGLNGRSFVPLLSGFACAIPGMLAARTIPSRRERLLTIFVMPLMSCSARLPVYALLLAFLTPADKPWIGGLGLTVIYLASVASGAVVAAIVSRFLPRSGRSAFMLELPSYRLPQLTIIGRSTYQRSRMYLVKAGMPILVISMALWLMCHLPQVPVEGLSPVEAQARQLEGSLAATAGRLLEPVMAPLGLDWRVGVALIASFAAREVFVGSLAVIFHVADEQPESGELPLVATMQGVKKADGSALFTTASGTGLVVFFILAMQCMATAAVAKKEAGSWWMPAAQTIVFTGLAYVATWGTVTGLRALGVA
jgi:ferrous iron transport protein B